MRNFFAAIMAALTGVSRGTVAAPASTVTKGAAWLTLALTAAMAFEGLRTTTYLDPVGIPTVCFGETLNVKPGDTYTVAECEAMLGKRLVQFDRELTACLPRLPTLAPETRAALVSWAYNVGTSAACKSTLVRRANAGDLKGACNELTKWVYATKAGVRVKLPGLVVRRDDEKAMCLRGLKA